MITYRMLPLEEWDKLIPLYELSFPGQSMPNPDVASVGVAEEDGKIVGFWFLQLCAHMEPAAVDPAFRGLVSLHKLFETVNNQLYENGCVGMEYYIHVATSEWDQPLQSAGFVPIGLAYSNKVHEKVDS